MAENEQLSFFREDGALTNTFSTLGSRSASPIASGKTGLGTTSDNLAESVIDEPVWLDYRSLSFLYRSNSICQRVVDLLPEDAILSYPPYWVVDQDANKGNEITNYAKKLQLFTELTKACKLGRLYGDGYLVMGIDDGVRDYSVPVQEKKIKSIRWVVAKSAYQIKPWPKNPGESYQNPDYYWLVDQTRRGLPDEENSTPSRLIHKSRLLRLPGTQLYDDGLIYNLGQNDSVLQSMLNSLINYLTSNQSGAQMLSRHSVFKYKIQDLAKLVQQNDQQTLMNRFNSILLGMSTVGGLVMDADKEDGEFINQTYTGVKDILEHLENNLVNDTGLPRSKLFGSAQSAFSEGGKSDRYEWANRVDRYRGNKVKPELEKLSSYIMLAKDSPTDGIIPQDWDIKFESALQLTHHEEADLRHNHAKTDEIYINLGVVTPEEIRKSRFNSSGGPNLEYDVTLDSSEMTQQQDSRQDDISEENDDILSDREFNKLAEIDDNDINNAMQHWKRVQTEQWSNILEAELGQDDESRQDSKTFTPPKYVAEEAAKPLRWRKEHGDEVNGGTRTGWIRANQLAKQEPVSLDIINRMVSFFARHEGNEKIAEEYKGTPWKDAGYVSWLLWGGEPGRRWANKIADQEEENDK